MEISKEQTRKHVEKLRGLSSDIPGEGTLWAKEAAEYIATLYAEHCQLSDLTEMQQAHILQLQAAIGEKTEEGTASASPTSLPDSLAALLVDPSVSVKITIHKGPKKPPAGNQEY